MRREISDHKKTIANGDRTRLVAGQPIMDLFALPTETFAVMPGMAR